MISTYRQKATPNPNSSSISGLGRGEANGSAIGSITTAQVPYPKQRAEVAREYIDVDQTMLLMLQIVAENYKQIALFSQQFKADTVREACAQIWHYVRAQVKYEDDDINHLKEGRKDPQEWLRTPQRLISDRKGDCDCATILISAILQQLQIPYFFRVVSWQASRDAWAHVYPVAIDEAGQEIAIDFIPEVPFALAELAHGRRFDVPAFLIISEVEKKLKLSNQTEKEFMAQTLVLSGAAVKKAISGALAGMAEHATQVITAKTQKEFFNAMGLQLPNFEEVVPKRAYVSGITKHLLEELLHKLRTSSDNTLEQIEHEARLIQNILLAWDTDASEAIQTAIENTLDLKFKAVYEAIDVTRKNLERIPHNERESIANLLKSVVMGTSNDTLGILDFLRPVFDSFGKAIGMDHNNLKVGIAAALNHSIEQPTANRTNTGTNTATTSSTEAQLKAVIAAQNAALEEEKKEREKKEKTVKYISMGAIGLFVIGLFIWAFSSSGNKKGNSGNALSGKKRKRKPATKRKTSTRKTSTAKRKPTTKRKTSTRRLSGAKPATKRKTSTRKTSTAKRKPATKRKSTTTAKRRVSGTTRKPATKRKTSTRKTSTAKRKPATKRKTSTRKSTAKRKR